MKYCLKILGIYVFIISLFCSTIIFTGHSFAAHEQIIPLQLSQERIDNHKKSIATLIKKRKWSRKAVKVLQTGATILTIAELVRFARDLFVAFEGEDNTPVLNQPEKKSSLGRLVIRAAVVAAAQTMTTFLLRRHYESVIQQETISWYVFTQAFYKVNSQEIKQRAIALDLAKDEQDKAYQTRAVVNAHNALIKQLEKIIAFMEYKIDYVPTANRPEARSLANHFAKSVTAYAQLIDQHIRTHINSQILLAELSKLESVIDRELLAFSRLEGDTAFSEQQYNALLQAQAI